MMNKDEFFIRFNKHDNINNLDLKDNEPHTFSLILGEDPELLENICDNTNTMTNQIYTYYPDLAIPKIKNIEAFFYMHDAYYIFEICSKLSCTELKKMFSQYDNSDNYYYILD